MSSAGILVPDHALQSAIAIVSKEQTPDEIKTERDVLLQVVQGAQQREQESERTIQLLLIAGHVKEDRVNQARELAKL
jgi:hypothetical protein